MKKDFRFLFIVLSAIWMAVIFLFSAQTGSQSGSLSTFLAAKLNHVFHLTRVMPFSMVTFLIRKAAHMTEYAILAILLLNILRAEQLSFKKAAVMWFICALYAASDEWHQTFVAARAGQPRDVAIDSVGAVIGILLCFMIRRKRYKKSFNRQDERKTVLPFSEKDKRLF